MNLTNAICKNCRRYVPMQRDPDIMRCYYTDMRTEPGWTCVDFVGRPEPIRFELVD